MGMTFKQFQEANATRCPEAFKHPLGSWSLLEWAGAMCGEAGEVANVCKKIKRQTDGVGGKWAARKDSIDGAKLRAVLADEIGDTLAYLSLLASAAGLDLGVCGARKFDEISSVAKWNGVQLLPKALET